MSSKRYYRLYSKIPEEGKKGLKKLLGHVRAPTLVDNVRASEDQLDHDNHGDEKAHAWRRGGNN